MRLTGGEIIAHCLKAYGVDRVAAIPGHGAWSMLDAFLRPKSTIPTIIAISEAEQLSGHTQSARERLEPTGQAA